MEEARQFLYRLKSVRVSLPYRMKSTNPKTTFIGIEFLSEFISKGLDKSKFFDFVAKKRRLK